MLMRGKLFIDMRVERSKFMNYFVFNRLFSKIYIFKYYISFLKKNKKVL